MHKKESIQFIKLPAYAEMLSDASKFTVSSLCNLGESFFEHQQHPHRHDFYAIFWIREGQLTHVIDQQTYEIHSGTICCIAPGQVHQLHLSDKVDGYLIAFKEDLCCPTVPGKSSPVYPDLFVNESFHSIIELGERPEVATLTWILNQMLVEIELRKAEFETAFRQLLQYFLILLSRVAQTHIQTVPQFYNKPNSTVFLQFKSLIDQQFRQLKTVSDYADALHIKAVQLNEISKQLSGITAGTHIRNRIILEAQRLLQHTDLSAKEIAYELGFEDPHYFSRFFKKYTSQAPSSYKETLK
jgi:AraC family transcriptional activator of pobA